MTKVISFVEKKLWRDYQIKIEQKALKLFLRDLNCILDLKTFKSRFEGDKCIVVVKNDKGIQRYDCLALAVDFDNIFYCLLPTGQRKSFLGEEVLAASGI